MRLFDVPQVSSQLEWLTTLSIPPKEDAGLNLKNLRKVSAARLATSSAQICSYSQTRSHSNFLKNWRWSVVC